jgi:hypothetical protein
MKMHTDCQKNADINMLERSRHFEKKSHAKEDTSSVSGMKDKKCLLSLGYNP